MAVRVHAVLQLSLDSRARYEKKLINCGLFADPYALTDDLHGVYAESVHQGGIKGNVNSFIF